MSIYARSSTSPLAVSFEQSLSSSSPILWSFASAYSTLTPGLSRPTTPKLCEPRTLIGSRMCSELFSGMKAVGALLGMTKQRGRGGAS